MFNGSGCPFTHQPFFARGIMNVNITIPEAALKEAIKNAITEFLPPPPIQRVSYKLAEAAKATGLSVSFLRLEISKKRLIAVQLDRCLLIEATELERYLTKRRLDAQGEEACRSTNEVDFIGTNSSSMVN
jgi:hypothetical protein